MSWRILLVAAALLATRASSAPFSNSEQRRFTPADISTLPTAGAGAGTSGVSGIRTTVLAGNPSEAAPYTIMLQVPAGVRIAAHTHRDARSAVVISGTWHFGYGTQAVDGRTKALGPHSFYTEPANVAHFARTGTKPVVLYISGVGPTDTHYTPLTHPPRP